MIVAVLSAVFDPLKGNTIEWSHLLVPDTTLPSSLEFSVIPSGAHYSTSDIIYFSPSPSSPPAHRLFGLAYCKSLNNERASLRRGISVRSGI